MFNKVFAARILVAAALLIGAITVSAQEYCFKDKLNQDLSGTWTGEDSYSLKFRKDRVKGTCVSLVEPSTNTVRKIVNVIVVNGNLRHLTYYTPSTDGYVSNVNISVKGEEMKFHWFSSYENKEGDDTYIRQKAGPTLKPGSPK